jgi:acetaldehyde dehydrogenase/alcohol dehydrogenase
MIAADKTKDAKFDYEVMLRRAKQAEEEFMELDQVAVDKIFRAIAHAADKHRVDLAILTVEETQMGLVEDKVLKNGLAAELICHRYKNTKTVGVIERNTIGGITKIATPVGTVVCITPTTNPTSTAVAKTLFLAKTRNVGVFLPHPRATKCTAEAIRVCHDAGVAAGAPKNFVQCVPDPPTLELSQAIMNHPCVNLILATGGPGMVKAAYSTGHPAIGVGSGNAPILVDETANLKQAVGSIVLGKTFDNGMICASEQSVVVVDAVYDELKTLLEFRGVHFLYGEEKVKLEHMLIVDGRVNVKVVGQSAIKIASMMDIVVPKGTVVLAAEESGIGGDFPLSCEKLSPVLALYHASNFDEAVDICYDITNHGGVGHTAGIYSADPERLEAYAKRIPAGRILANMPTSLSAIGTEFNHDIDPSFTLGVGTHAGSSTNDNVGPMHLLNIRTLAIRQAHIEWYRNPPDIYYNRGCLEEALNDCSRQLKSGFRLQRCMIVTDKVMGIMGFVDRLKEALVSKGFTVCIFDDVNPDPDMTTVRKGVEACEAFQPDFMVCLGGGSPMDAGKYIRVQYENPGFSLEDSAARFLELRKRTCPFPVLGTKIKKVVCIPTTSGTASEVTPFSVITDDEGMKHPLFSYRLTPDIAIIDSSFCEALPKSLVAFAGIDAITHAVEAFVSVVANEFTEGHSLRALKLLFANLADSYHKGTPEAREAVHHGATLAGLAFSNSFLGICHSLAHKMGAAFHLPHGLTCGILLPHVIVYNSCKNPTRMGIYPGYDHPIALDRYAIIARYLDMLPEGSDEEQMRSLVKHLYELYQAMNVPLSFQAAGVNEARFLAEKHDIALRAFDDQCTPANPRFPLVSELEDILEQAFYYTPHLDIDLVVVDTTTRTALESVPEPVPECTTTSSSSPKEHMIKYLAALKEEEKKEE